MTATTCADRWSVENTGTALAFQVHLKLVDAESGDELLPVFWDDNYFELLPGETRAIRVAYPRSQRRSGAQRRGGRLERAARALR